MASADQSRVAWLDTAKGLGIVLVVIGHLVAKTPPLGHEWWMLVKNAIYAFHMPFFMIVSGFTCFAFTRKFSGWPGFGRYVWKRFDRLMVPFLIFGLVIFMAKHLASRVAHVDNPVGADSRPWDILVDPMSSYSAYLWYVYVLFLFSLCVPFLVKLGKTGLGVAALLAFLALGALYNGDLKAVAIFRTLVVNAPYFLVGGVMAAAPPTASFRRWGWLLVPPFALLVHAALQPSATWPVMLATQIIGAAAALWLAFVIGNKDQSVLCRHLTWVGGFAFPIYLMNTATIGIMKAVLLKVMPWDGWRFFAFLPAMFLAGLYGPMFIQNQIIERLPVLRRLLRR
jgi:fucose 4-O-acetylase-like acetyltransferase